MTNLDMSPSVTTLVICKEALERMGAPGCEHDEQLDCDYDVLQRSILTTALPLLRSRNVKKFSTELALNGARREVWVPCRDFTRKITPASSTYLRAGLLLVAEGLHLVAV